MNASIRFRAAYRTMLAVVALAPLALIALAMIGLMFVLGPVFAYLYPYFFVGGRDIDYHIYRFFPWPIAAFLTLMHWLVLSAVFAQLAKRLQGISLVTAAVFFLLIVGLGTYLVCTSAGIQLPVEQPHM